MGAHLIVFPHTRVVRDAGRVEIPQVGARSLVWVAGELFDVAAGWRRFPLDGSVPVSRYASYGTGFDAAAVSPGGDVIALVSSSGTKGLLLRPDGGLIRELGRSYYHADAYRYPLALFTRPGGRTGLVHCPAAYNRLEIEDALTGAPLTAPGERNSADVFHSRLAVSTSGRYLLSAGWVWQPWGCLMVYDLPRALVSPQVLDTYGVVFDMRGLIQAEISGACFIDDDVAVSTSAEPNDQEGPEDLAPCMLARWSTAASSGSSNSSRPLATCSPWPTASWHCTSTHAYMTPAPVSWPWNGLSCLPVPPTAPLSGTRLSPDQRGSQSTSHISASRSLMASRSPLCPGPELSRADQSSLHAQRPVMPLSALADMPMRGSSRDSLRQ